MKTKITRKELRARHTDIFICSDIGYLLSYRSPSFYNCGSYGWNWDCYSVGSVALLSGYRNFIGYRVSYDLQHEYNEKAREIINNWDIGTEEKIKRVNALLNEFIDKICA